MRAAYYEKNGSAAEVLHVGEVETPQPGSGEVRVKLKTSGVNPSDVKTRAGSARKIAFPRVIPQSVRGAIGGFVTDPSGLAVPTAHVNLTQVDTGRTRSMVATPQGSFLFALLSPGEYRVEELVRRLPHLRREIMPAVGMLDFQPLLVAE